MQDSISRVIRTTNILSAVLAFIAAVSLPSIYFSLGYRQQVSILETETEVNAHIASGIINANPLLWHYEVYRLEDLLSRRATDRTREVRRIFDKKGNLIAQNADTLELPIVKRRSDLLDSGHIAGRLEISRSLRPLLNTTALLGFGGLAFGLAIYATLRLFPLHALRETLQRLEQLNSTLAQRVNEEVEKGRERDHLLIQQSKLAAMGEMIGNIAHQWRQPLNTVGLIVQDIRNAHQAGELDAEYLDESVKKAMEVILHMSLTIDAFRYFYKPEKEPGKFSVVDAVGRAVFFVEESFRKSHIEIELDIKDDLAADGFPNEYSQVLMNLLNNARDVLTEGNIERPKVLIRLFREGDKAVVTVRDNGGGIPVHVMDRIFDPYFTTKKEGKGTGIGLYMSKMIIEKSMNGRLEATNTEDGAEFRIEI
ncbi:MAG: HAMP domain-containing histidine kinase [Nitrospirae bacterium]|nr:HAMP domain-containing histidine kinase [Nitrospirota bacterium]